MSTSQKEGVFHAVVAFFEESNRKFESGMKVELNTAERKTIIGMLVAATVAGELEVKSAQASADLNKYWNGTLSNWLRRDERLNGGVKEVLPKNPGSRQGSGDAELKELKKLLAQVTLSGVQEHITAVQKAIDARNAHIAAEQAKKVAIDFSKLDPKLRALFVKEEEIEDDAELTPKEIELSLSHGDECEISDEVE